MKNCDTILTMKFQNIGISSEKIGQYVYFTYRSRMIEQAKFISGTLRKPLEKQKTLTDYQGINKYMLL